MSEALINTLEYKIDLKIIWSCELKNVIYTTTICFPLTRTNKLRELTDLREHYLKIRETGHLDSTLKLKN